jgi:hypothetical protein
MYKKLLWICYILARGLFCSSVGTETEQYIFMNVNVVHRMVREKPSSEKKTRIVSYPMPPPHIPRPPTVRRPYAACGGSGRRSGPRNRRCLICAGVGGRWETERRYGIKELPKLSKKPNVIAIQPIQWLELPDVENMQTFSQIDARCIHELYIVLKKYCLILYSYISSILTRFHEPTT